MTPWAAPNSPLPRECIGSRSHGKSQCPTWQQCPGPGRAVPKQVCAQRKYTTENRRQKEDAFRHTHTRNSKTRPSWLKDEGTTEMLQAEQSPWEGTGDGRRTSLKPNYVNSHRERKWTGGRGGGRHIVPSHTIRRTTNLKNKNNQTTRKSNGMEVGQPRSTKKYLSRPVGGQRWTGGRSGGVARRQFAGRTAPRRCVNNWGVRQTVPPKVLAWGYSLNL